MTLARTSLPATGAPSTSSTAGLVFSCSMACLARPRAGRSHVRPRAMRSQGGRDTHAQKPAVLTGLHTWPPPGWNPHRLPAGRPRDTSRAPASPGAARPRGRAPAGRRPGPAAGAPAPVHGRRVDSVAPAHVLHEQDGERSRQRLPRAASAMSRRVQALARRAGAAAAATTDSRGARAGRGGGARAG
jgi:hypothetical protein